MCVSNKHNNLGKYDLKVKHFIVKMTNSEEFLRNVAFKRYTYAFFFFWVLIDSITFPV